jgi:hypothetical protein
VDLGRGPRWRCPWTVGFFRPLARDLPHVVPLGAYARRRRDQPAWWTRRAIDMFVSDVNIQPNRTGLPGIASLESIVGALLTFGLVAAVAGIAISAIAWAIGSHSGNPHVAGKGKSGVLVALGAAFLIGGATSWSTSSTPRVACSHEPHGWALSSVEMGSGRDRAGGARSRGDRHRQRTWVTDLDRPFRRECGQVAAGSAFGMVGREPPASRRSLAG